MSANSTTAVAANFRGNLLDELFADSGVNGALVVRENNENVQTRAMTVYQNNRDNYIAMVDQETTMVDNPVAQTEERSIGFSVQISVSAIKKTLVVAGVVAGAALALYAAFKIGKNSVDTTMPSINRYAPVVLQRAGMDEKSREVLLKAVEATYAETMMTRYVRDQLNGLIHQVNGISL